MDTHNAILNDGAPAWWWVRDVTKAHLVIDVQGAADLNRAIVITRCGDRWRQARLERRWDAENYGQHQKCRTCAQDGVIR